MAAPDSAVTQPKPSREKESSLTQRGTTTIPANVVARIAAQAASYVDGDDSGDEGDGSAFGTYGGPDRDWHSLV